MATDPSARHPDTQDTSRAAREPRGRGAAMMPALAATLLLAALAAGCQPGGGSDGSDDSDGPAQAATSGAGGPGFVVGEVTITDIECSAPLVNSMMQEVMAEWYLWRDELRGLDATRYDDSDAFLRDFRVERDRFSFLAEIAAADSLFQEGRFVGYGFGHALEDGALRITFVYPGSPMDLAGARRTDRVTAIGGVPTADLLAAGTLYSTLGQGAVPGAALELEITDAAGAARVETVVSAWVDLTTVLRREVLESAGRKVGYLAFTSFVETSKAELEAAFGEFKAAGVEELVLDLRYNGGGVVDVAELLGDLIAPPSAEGQVFNHMAFNARKSDLLVESRFKANPLGLGLSRVAVLASAQTCSASEIVIHNLAPHLEVVTVGSATCGKPVGMYQFNFQLCGKAFFPVTFQNLNSEGDGDYFDGIPARCAAADGLDRELGDPGEGMLAGALAYLETGACAEAPATVRAAARNDAERKDAAPAPLEGLRQTHGAF